MKKLLILLLAIGLCIGLLGCTETPNIPSGNPKPVSEATTLTETAQATEATKATESTKATENTEATESTEATEVVQATESTQNNPDDTNETLVWIPTKGGKKYHSKSSCSGMEEPDQVTQSQAEQQGFTPCKKCYK